MTQSYQSLAAVYDQVQQTDFSVWAEYICRLDQRYGRKNRPGDGRDGRPILLDLGCGTGGFCLEMAARGYDPIGIDASAAMLNEARDKMLQSDPAPGGPPCLFLQQDISCFELYGTVDLIVCLLDTVNHLLRQDAVRRLFRHCNHYLNPGGILVFDLATWQHLADTLGNNLFFVDQPDFTLFWQHRFFPGKRISQTDLILYAADTTGQYRRTDERIRERYYDADEISRFMSGTELTSLAQAEEKVLCSRLSGKERTFYLYRKEKR